MEGNVSYILKTFSNILGFFYTSKKTTQDKTNKNLVNNLGNLMSGGGVTNKQQLLFVSGGKGVFKRRR